MATTKKIARKTRPTKRPLLRTTTQSIPLPEAHARRLRSVSAGQRQALSKLLSHTFRQADGPIHDDGLLAWFALLGENAEIIDAVASFLESEARS